MAPWNKAEEITFECEPGTLTESKLATIRRLGVTRLSLGVENFDDHILEMNGRAHRSPEIGQAYRFARALEFPQINIDLIAGMVGETDANWRVCIEKTLELEPDSVTIYQMELPFNTTISKDLLKGHGAVHRSDRELGDQAAMGRAKRSPRSKRPAITCGAPTPLVKDPTRTRFVYTDRLWQGADMAGLGVASFGHVNGVHMQNLDTWETYSAAIERGEIPLNRAYRPTDEERLIRELVLQLKLGSVAPRLLPDKYGVNILRAIRASSSPRSTPRAISRSRADDSRLAVAAGTAADRFAAAALLPAPAHRDSLHVDFVVGRLTFSRCVRLRTCSR